MRALFVYAAENSVCFPELTRAYYALVPGTDYNHERERQLAFPDLIRH